jgi:uncharacterized membrane protein
VKNGMEQNSSQTFNLKIEKGYIAAVAIALIVVSCIAAGYFILNPLKPSGYSEMYLLDNQNQAVNYPQVLVANKNSTFNAPVLVVNHIPQTTDFQLQVKIVQDTVSFPVNATANDTYQFTLTPEQSWSSQVPVSINQPGAYSIVLELYSKNGEDYEFTNNYLVLHVEVVTDLT